MIIMTPEEAELSYYITKRALQEDIGGGDCTTDATVSPRKTAYAVITAKSPGILAGNPFCAQAFAILNNRMSFYFPVEEGSKLKSGDRVLEIRGNARAILKAERTALNLLGRISGIATKTAQFVGAVKETNVKILDTRKTAPGLRIFDKYAVRAGGGHNHRFGLYDMFLIKENHITAADGAAEAVRRCITFREHHNLNQPIIAEAGSLETALKEVEAGADRILLDNMMPETVREAVPAIRNTAKKIGRRIEIEVSGGITLKNCISYAETGIDYISVGALTHSVTATDFSLLILDEL
jgi:nicotinate-nucleotide pyrophosphorylase (carboxylating)